MKLTDTACLVTGGASGLGRATVEAFLDGGGRVVIADLPSSPGETVAKELGDAVRFVPTDVTDEAQVQAAVDAAVESFGPLRVAVSCAGIGWIGRTVSRDGPHPLDLFKKVVEVNLIGTFNVIRLAGAQMVSQEAVDGEKGVLINTASIAAFDGQIGQIAYVASKGGVAAMTLTVARDMASLLVRCCTIAPGTMNTPMLALLPDPARQALADQIPHPRRLGEPAEYGALARHIVENQFLNGETIRLDGGLRMPPK